jgi:hypothetical protein
LLSGQPVEFRVRLKYNLASADRVRLQVFGEEFPFAAGGCTGSVHSTNGGSYLVSARGSDNPTVTLKWLGDKPVYPKGFIALGVNFVTPEVNGKVIKSFGLFPQFCYHFFPVGQPIDGR